MSERTDRSRRPCEGGVLGRPRVQTAAAFCEERHAGQTRKGSGAPYASHPFRVAAILAEHGFGEDVVIAGYCHDLTEDTATTGEELAALFGARVAELVAAASEPDKGATWEVRKATTVAKVPDLDVEAAALVLADKIEWHDSVLADLAAGRDPWAQFKRGRVAQHRHFLRLTAAFSWRALREARLRPLFNLYLSRYQQLWNVVAPIPWEETWAAMTPEERREYQEIRDDIDPFR